jgi:hypothetical protein
MMMMMMMIGRRCDKHNNFVCVHKPLNIGASIAII